MSAVVLVAYPAAGLQGRSRGSPRTLPPSRSGEKIADVAQPFATVPHFRAAAVLIDTWSFGTTQFTTWKHPSRGRRANLGQCVYLYA